jgi:hypothetical protein
MQSVDQICWDSKVLAAFLKDVGFIILFMDSMYASYLEEQLVVIFTLD